MDSTYVEKTTLRDYKKQIFLFVHHNMQLAKHLCCNPGQLFNSTDLDGPDDHDAPTETQSPGSGSCTRAVVSVTPSYAEVKGMRR